MSVKSKEQVSYRLNRLLLERLRDATRREVGRFPPPPSQTEVIERGIELVLQELKPAKRKA